MPTIHSWSACFPRCSASASAGGGGVSGHATSGVPKFTGTEPSGCKFLADRRAWTHVLHRPQRSTTIARSASYTHNIALSAGARPELRPDAFPDGEDRLHQMEEVAGIPRLPAAGDRVYAPLGDAPVDPDVVLFTGRPGRVMLCRRAALRAGCGGAGSPARRPHAWRCGRPRLWPVASQGCIGNRVSPMWGRTSCTSRCRKGSQQIVEAA